MLRREVILSQKKLGAVLSYISTVLNMLISIFLTPFILNAIGDAEYGVYRIVQSFVGQLAMISIGMGTIMAVLIAKTNVRTDSEKAEYMENLVATGIAVSAVLAVLVAIIGAILGLFIDGLYNRTLSVDQLALAKRLYVILVVNIALILFNDVFIGIIHGYERFVFSHGMKVVRLILRAGVIIFLLSMGMGTLALVFCDLSLTLFLLICDLWYCFGRLKIKVKFHSIDKALIRGITSFAAAIILQVFVNQVNQNLDSVILGSMIQPELVAVYSLALTIYVAFNSLSSSVGSIFSPEAARRVQMKQSESDMQNFTIKVGRYQFFVIAFILGGFVSCGKNFVNVWVGCDKQDVYFLTLILMIPMALANTMSGANSVLDGYMKRMGRSVILTATAIINIISSIIMIHYIGYWGAAIGTACSVIIGQIILLSHHYHKVFGFRLGAYLTNVFRGLLPTMLISIIASLLFQLIPVNDWVLLIVKGTVYMLVYILGIMIFKSNSKEKELILGALRKREEK